MSLDKTSKINGHLWRCLAVFILLILLSGCTSQQKSLKKDFPLELISRAKSDFKSDITDWDIISEKPVEKRINLVIQRAWGVETSVQEYSELKLTKYLNAREFELDPNAPTELMVYIVKASEIRKPVRSAKIRMVVKLSNKESTEPILLGIVDGIEPRPDLSSGVWMPRSSYFRAAQYAISKLIHQLDNLHKASPSP